MVTVMILMLQDTQMQQKLPEMELIQIAMEMMMIKKELPSR